jgi:hypothetical protein
MHFFLGLFSVFNCGSQLSIKSIEEKEEKEKGKKTTCTLPPIVICQFASLIVEMHTV